MTKEEKIEYLARAVMTLSELGDGKTACALNEIRLEMKSQLELSEDMEEAADKYAERLTTEPYLQVVFKTDFIAGADWMKSQMMEKAIEGVARPDDCEIWVNLVGYGYKFEDGDKVKIIIVKENEK